MSAALDARALFLPRPSCRALLALRADVAAGGQELRATDLSSDLFEAGSMRVATKDLMAMKVDELKEELEARGEAMSGSKAWLRRRLHAAIVREYLDAEGEASE